MELLDIKIGEKLRGIRENKGYKLREVGEIIGIDYSYINKIEKGKIPSLTKLKKLCALYNVPVAYLFEEETDDERNERDGLSERWRYFIKEMEQKDISPEEIILILDAFKVIRKL